MLGTRHDLLFGVTDDFWRPVRHELEPPCPSVLVGTLYSFRLPLQRK